MVKKIVKQKQPMQAVEVPKLSGRRARSGKTEDPKPVEDKRQRDDEIIGVKVHTAADFIDPNEVNKNLPPMEEAKAAPEEPTVAELLKNKKKSMKKALTADAEGAFNLYIFRVLKE